MTRPTVLEICAGAGGQSLGLDLAGFEHVAAIDIDADACETLRLNRPFWDVLNEDVAAVCGHQYEGVDLLAGGVPCPPFSIAGKQLGRDDERDLFPQALRLVREARPRAILLENVRGFASKKFAKYRSELIEELRDLGYEADWKVLNASDYGVSQLRPRFVLVALQQALFSGFRWPDTGLPPDTVGDKLFDLMSAKGWCGADEWRVTASGIAPTVVGGSKKHGGPDLGPTRAREDWKKLGVDGKGIADEAPGPETPASCLPRLTVRMVARIQGFPDDWAFFGRKTTSYKQVGNAFPPPVATAVGSAIFGVLTMSAEARGQIRLLDAAAIWKPA